MYKKNKIAIFGAAGNLGGCVLEALRQQDRPEACEFVAVAHAKPLESGGFETRSAEFADPDSLDKVLRSVDTAIYALPVHAEMEAWNRNVVDAADRCRVERLIRFSMPMADSSSTFLPLRVHGNMDEYALGRQFGEVVIARPNFFMQYFANHHRHMVIDGRLQFPQDEGSISYVDLQDVGAAVLKILASFDDYRGQVIDMTGAVAWNNAEIAEIFSDVLKRQCVYQPVEASASSGGATRHGIDAFSMQYALALQDLVSMNEFSSIGDGIHTILNRRPHSFHGFVMDNRRFWE